MTAPILVTGASGFIGRAVCQTLARRGIPVLAASRRIPDRTEHGEWITVSDYARLSRSVPLCIHLAGDRRAGASADVVELGEPARIAKGLVDAGFDRVVFASSAVVYGDESSALRRESEVVNPTAPYAQAKRQAELVFLEAGHTVARLANVYGPGMASDNVLADILAQLGESGPIRVRNAAPVRDYLHVEDAAEALVALALEPIAGVFNVSTGVGTSVRDLARLLLTLAGESHREVESTLPSTADSHLVLDPSKVRSAVGWEARRSLQEGLADLVLSNPRLIDPRYR